jgi:hypothetical protein
LGIKVIREEMHSATSKNPELAKEACNHLPFIGGISTGPCELCLRMSSLIFTIITVNQYHFPYLKK